MGDTPKEAVEEVLREFLDGSHEPYENLSGDQECATCWRLWPCSSRQLAAEIARLRHAARTRPDYDLRCEYCGAPHWFDTSLPTDIWNQIASPGAVLCVLCIDARLRAKGLKAEAEFYFVGAALVSRPYAESYGEIARLRTELENAKKPGPCSVCAGRPLPSGKDCICGDGRRTEWDEMEGLRRRCFELEDENERLRSAPGIAAARVFPMLNGPPIPWSLARVIYAGYSHLYGNQQTLERIAERGGFGWNEVAMMWNDYRKPDARAAMRAALTLAGEIRELRQEFPGATTTDGDLNQDVQEGEADG